MRYLSEWASDGKAIDLPRAYFTTISRGDLYFYIRKFVVSPSLFIYGSSLLLFFCTNYIYHLLFVF